MQISGNQIHENGGFGGNQSSMGVNGTNRRRGRGCMVESRLGIDGSAVNGSARQRSDWNR